MIEMLFIAPCAVLSQNQPKQGFLEKFNYSFCDIS